MEAGETNDHMLLILPEKVSKAVEHSKIRKASGSDKLNAEIIKNIDEEGIKILTKISNRIYTTGQIP